MRAMGTIFRKTLSEKQFSFLLYGIEVWHGTYANITNKILILQKRHAGPSIICLSKLTQPNTKKMQNI